MSAKQDTPEMTREQIEAAAAALGLVVKAQPTERSRPAPFADTPEDKARLAWIAANARPALSPCLCGCGELTKGRFAPGHDAVLKSRLAQTPGDQARDIERAMGWPDKEPEVKETKES
jgi:hypothetical protein